MVLVVVLHISLWADNALAETVFRQISLFLLPFRIPVFFLISGILAASSLKNKPHKAVIRAFNIYTVYLIWTTIITVRLHAMPGADDHISLGTYVLNAIIPGHYWYLWALPAYYALSLLLLRISPSRPWLWFPMALAGYYYAGELAEYARSMFTVTAETVYWEKAASCFLWFWTGICGARILRDFGDRTFTALPARYSNIAIVRIAMIVVAVGAIAVISLGYLNFGRWTEILLSVAFAVIAFIVFPPMAGTKPSHVLQYIGQNTLPVYIFHKLLLIILMAAESRTKILHSSLSEQADLAVMMLTALLITISLLLGKLVKASPLAFLLNGFLSARPTLQPQIMPSR